MRVRVLAYWIKWSSGKGLHSINRKTLSWFGVHPGIVMRIIRTYI